jgi:hypothetical protein
MVKNLQPTQEKTSGLARSDVQDKVSELLKERNLTLANVQRLEGAIAALQLLLNTNGKE